jgi:hypothetical protein
MAGTGHSYEIANPSALAEYCDGLRLLFSGIPEMTGRFSRADFRKFLTSPGFCRLLKNPDSSEIDASEQPWIIRKLAAGQDVRLFSSAHADDFGPDFPHIRDYLHHIRLFDMPAYAKAVRADFATLAAKARGWRFRFQTISTEEPKTRVALEIEHSLYWVELENGSAMSDEGRAQNHCVGTLYHLRENGSHRYFSLRDGSDTSFVTAELNVTGQCYWVQIRGKGNAAVPFEYQGASAALFNLFEGDPVLSQHASMSAGLHFSDGRWSPIADDWAPLEIDHLKLLSDGYARAAVFSPVDEERVFAMIVAYPSSPAEQWWTSLDLKSGSIRLSANRHIHELEYRAACLLANKCNMDIRSDDDDSFYDSFYANNLVRKVNGIWEFLYDRYPSKVTLSGTKYSQSPCDKHYHLVHHSSEDYHLAHHSSEDYHLVHHSSDKTRILATAKDGKLVLDNVGRINTHELGRLLDVATALNISEVEVHKNDQRRFFSRFRPCRDKHGLWFDIRQEGVTEPVPLSSLNWYCARNIKVLIGSVGQQLLTMTISENTAHVTSPGGIGSVEIAKALVDEANRLRLVSMTCETVMPTLAWIYHLKGRWEYLPTVTKLDSYLMTLPDGAKSLTREEHLRLEVLTWQQHWNPAFQPIILTNVLRWLETVNEHVLSMMPMAAHAGPYSDGIRLLFSVAGRLIWLADKRDQLSASQSVSLRRVLAMVFERLCSTSPSKTGSNAALAISQIVTRYRDCFTQKQIYSAAIRALHRVFNFIAPKKPDELAPFEADWLRWYEVMLPHLPAGRLRSYLVDQVRQGVIVAIDFNKATDIAMIERVTMHYRTCRALPACGSHWEWHMRALNERIMALTSDERMTIGWQRVIAITGASDTTQQMVAS